MEQQNDDRQSRTLGNSGRIVETWPRVDALVHLESFARCDLAAAMEDGHRLRNGRVSKAAVADVARLMTMMTSTCIVQHMRIMSAFQPEHITSAEDVRTVVRTRRGCGAWLIWTEKMAFPRFSQAAT
jgi:hypothetical protein